MSALNRILLRRSQVVVLALCYVGLSSHVATAQTGVQAASAGGSQASSGVKDESASHPLVANSGAKLGIGDLIEVAVFGIPDLQTKTRISGSGDIYLPLIDYVHVADLTTDEAQELIQKAARGRGLCAWAACFGVHRRSAVAGHYDGWRTGASRALHHFGQPHAV